MKDISFLLELQKLAVEMDDLVEKYGIDSFFELEEIINFISTTYDYDPPYTIEDFEDDVDTMLKDLDIDTE